MTKPVAHITDPAQHILPPALMGGPVSPSLLIGSLLA